VTEGANALLAERGYDPDYARGRSSVHPQHVQDPLAKKNPSASIRPRGLHRADAEKGCEGLTSPAGSHPQAYRPAGPICTGTARRWGVEPLRADVEDDEVSLALDHRHECPRGWGRPWLALLADGH
jgi:hypothetical protein